MVVSFSCKDAVRYGKEYSILKSIFIENNIMSLHDIEQQFPYFGKTKIKKALHMLCINNIVSQLDAEGIKNKIIKSKRYEHALGIGSCKCSWCGIKTAILHNHHYPTRKSNGGDKTIGICPNCHSEYHYLEHKYFYNGVKR